MAKTKISEFSATPANNTDIDSINIAEGCAPSGINDAIRELMAQLKDFQTGAVNDSFNGPVGTTTAAAGAFTTLSASSTVSGTGFSTYLASPPSIGSTAAGTGAFTTLAASGAVTLSGGTANGVTYLNGSKVLTSGSALTFDGSTLKVQKDTNGAVSSVLTLRNDGTGFSGVGINFAQFTGTNGYIQNQYTGSGWATDVYGYDIVRFFNGATPIEQMRLTSTGLGIGTSSPSNKLVVSNAGAAGLEFAPGETNGPTIYSYNRSTSAWATLQTFASQQIFCTNGTTERMRLDSSGNLGIGTSSPQAPLHVSYASQAGLRLSNTSGTPSDWYLQTLNGGALRWYSYTASEERMRLDSSGNLLVGSTSTSGTVAGANLYANGEGSFVRSSGSCIFVNRLTDDGTLIALFQDSTQEGSISVSGTTVSYNGGHLSRWAQTTGTKDDTLLKGTVLSNLDEMSQYVDADGNPVANEQLNKVKVSDVEGDANVAGVFVNWTHDDAHNVDEINMAMTGDMIIRIAKGTTVQRGDLLMSAGNGTAKPQGDDIVRSKTVAKVTSTHVTCTYADGSFCVPCVLMAC